MIAPFRKDIDTLKGKINSGSWRQSIDFTEDIFFPHEGSIIQKDEMRFVAAIFQHSTIYNNALTRL